MATKGSDARSWGGGIDLKPGPCYTCKHFRGWFQDGSARWAIWCIGIPQSYGKRAKSIFRDYENGCWRLERETAVDDGTPVPAAAMTMHQLYGRYVRTDDEWVPDY